MDLSTSAWPVWATGSEGWGGDRFLVGAERNLGSKRPMDFEHVGLALQRDASGCPKSEAL